MRIVVSGGAGVGVMALSLGLAAIAPPRGGQQPTFRGATEIVVIDTQVVARDGTPIDGLTPEQFEVFVDGRRRPTSTSTCST